MFFKFSLAHELSHAYQHENDSAPMRNRRLELQADCIAGYTLKKVFDLNIEDIEESLKVMKKLGDDKNFFDSDSHGTLQQRKEAFLRGYNSNKIWNPDNPEDMIGNAIYNSDAICYIGFWD